MGAAAELDAINWITVVVSAALSVTASLIAALLMARATVAGARQQALETERMRLRYEAATGRLRQFNVYAAELLRGMVEGTLGGPGLARLESYLQLEAELVSGPYYGTRVEAAVHVFQNACLKAERTMRTEGDDALRTDPDVGKPLWDSFRELRRPVGDAVDRLLGDGSGRRAD